MSSRTLRKLEHSTNLNDVPTTAIKPSEIDENLNKIGENEEQEVTETAETVNPFDLLNQAEVPEVDDTSPENSPDSPSEKSSKISETSQPTKSTKKRKNKKKKSGKKPPVASPDDNSNFDEILEEFAAENSRNIPNIKEDDSANYGAGETSSAGIFVAAESELFRVEHRNLNPDTEMKRIFGSRIVDPELRKHINAAQRRAPRGRGAPEGRLVLRRQNWPPLGSTGLSMRLVENLPGGVNRFMFTHGQTYQEAQIAFWEAVDSMNPDVFIGILRDHPYHIDTLLQMSEIMKTNEDLGGAKDFVERALFACEAACHPLFNLTQYNSRLDYCQQENRPFFMALLHHMTFLYKRGCNRTALEFCKLIYSLNPDQDPLGMLLIIDFLALKSRQYDYLMDLYRGLEASKNLSLLPNFAYSTALAMFLKTEEMDGGNSEVDLKLADDMIQDALLKFPTVLMPILDKCSVEPDKEVTSCQIFGPEEQIKDSNGLKQLISLYVARTEDLWKEPPVIGWLERNVRIVVGRIPKGKGAKMSMLEEYRHIRRTRYQGTPRNILRHIVISELKDALATLPAELRETAILNLDPLPPLNSQCNYERPEIRRRPLNDSFLTGLFRSLMPNYDPDAQAVAQALDAGNEVGGAVGGAPAGVEGGGNELQNSVRHLLNAMRDLLNNVQVEGPQREDGHLNDGAEEWEEDDGDWLD